MFSNATPSGIIIDAQTGKRYIPSSTRPNGTKRKEIRVRPGYQPEEDIKRYKCPAMRGNTQKSQEQSNTPDFKPLDSLHTKREAGSTTDSDNPPNHLQALQIPMIEGRRETTTKCKKAPSNNHKAETIGSNEERANDWEQPPDYRHKSKTDVRHVTVSRHLAGNFAAQLNVKTASETEERAGAVHKWPKDSDTPRYHNPESNIEYDSAVSNKNVKQSNSSRYPEKTRKTRIPGRSHGVNFDKQKIHVLGAEAYKSKKEDPTNKIAKQDAKNQLNLQFNREESRSSEESAEQKQDLDAKEVSQMKDLSKKSPDLGEISGDGEANGPPSWLGILKIVEEIEKVEIVGLRNEESPMPGKNVEKR
jgi:partner of Y14 and mago protein